MYHHNLKPSFRLVVSALLASSVSKALRSPGVCLFILLLILSCGFPVRAQRSTQSIIFADEFESDPSSR